MRYTTYILISEIKPKTYVGHTNNLSNRLKEHNIGESLYTSRYKPWRVIYIEKFETEDKSVKREKYFKSAVGRRWIKKNLFSI